MPALTRDRKTGLMPLSASGFRGYCSLRGLCVVLGVIVTDSTPFIKPTSYLLSAHSVFGISFNCGESMVKFSFTMLQLLFTIIVCFACFVGTNSTVLSAFTVAGNLFLCTPNPL